jgi:hypothetical protein
VFRAIRLRDEGESHNDNNKAKQRKHEEPQAGEWAERSRQVLYLGLWRLPGVLRRARAPAGGGRLGANLYHIDPSSHFGDIELHSQQAGPGLGAMALEKRQGSGSMGALLEHTFISEVNQSLAGGPRGLTLSARAAVSALRAA